MEQYPKVLLEFAAAGKPIVTSDVGDSRCIVDDGVNGYVVPRFDSVTTAHRILDLLSDSNMARQMGSNGRIRVETEFTMNAMVNRLKKHYCSLIE